MRRLPGAPAGAVFAALMAAAAPPAAAHVVYGRPSLAALVAGADVVARARIERADGAVAVGASGERRPVIIARLLELLKGDLETGALETGALETGAPETGAPETGAPGTGALGTGAPGIGPVRFAQHGHGVASFVPGEEVLLFLQAIGRSRELAGLAAAGGLRWVSLQEEGAGLVLTDASRPAFVAAVRGYVAAQAADSAAADPAAALAAGREVTFRLLRSPQPRLAEMALLELVARSGELLTPDSLPALEPVLVDPRTPIGVRLGLLAELDRLDLVDGPPRWASLLATTAPPELLAVVRAAGAHPSAAVNEELIRLLGAGDPSLAEAAAIALGVPGNDGAVAPLAATLRGGEPPLPMAAIRGLGRIGTPAALAALEAAAGDHPDEAVRRRAAAEVRRLRLPGEP